VEVVHEFASRMNMVCQEAKVVDDMKQAYDCRRSCLAGSHTLITRSRKSTTNITVHSLFSANTARAHSNFSYCQCGSPSTQSLMNVSCPLTLLWPFLFNESHHLLHGPHLTWLKASRHRKLRRFLTLVFVKITSSISFTGKGSYVRSVNRNWLWSCFMPKKPSLTSIMHTPPSHILLQP
jgi:hypothetical protein